MIVTNGKIYIICATCGKLVRINKPLLGSMHACLPPEEIRQRKKLTHNRK